MLPNKMVSNVDMFSSRRDDICVGNSACALVVAVDWEWYGRWKRRKGKKQLDPDGFFNGVC